jgi:hypothetical protein
MSAATFVREIRSKRWSKRNVLAAFLAVIPLVLVSSVEAPESRAAEPFVSSIFSAQAFDYVSCATECQVEIDQRMARCSGYRLIRDPNDRSAPLPRCRGVAIEQFERCMTRCPAETPAIEGIAP